MRWLLHQIQHEPAAFSEAVRLTFVLLFAYGVFAGTEQQQALVFALVSTVLTFLTRHSVVPRSKLENGGGQ